MLPQRSIHLLKAAQASSRLNQGAAPCKKAFIRISQFRQRLIRSKMPQICTSRHLYRKSPGILFHPMSALTRRKQPNDKEIIYQLSLLRTVRRPHHQKMGLGFSIDLPWKLQPLVNCPLLAQDFMICMASNSNSMTPQWCYPAPDSKPYNCSRLSSELFFSFRASSTFPIAEIKVHPSGPPFKPLCNSMFTYPLTRGTYHFHNIFKLRLALGSAGRRLWRFIVEICDVRLRQGIFLLVQVKHYLCWR